MMKNKGSVLIPVVILLSLIALTSYYLNQKTSAQLHISEAYSLDKEVDYIAGAAMAHAKWLLAQQTSCNNYPAKATYTLGEHSYDIEFITRSGSPVTIEATGRHKTGIIRTLKHQQSAFQANQTVTVYPWWDSYLDENNPSSQFSMASALQMAKATDESKHAIYKFYIEQWLKQPIMIEQADLKLNVEQTSLNNDIELAGLSITTEWLQSEANWQKSNAAQIWTSAGGDIDTSVDVKSTILQTQTGNHTLEVTGLFRQWMNENLKHQGVLVKPTADTETSVRVSSLESGTCISSSTLPKLEVTYRCECGKTCQIVPNKPIATQPAITCSFENIPDTAGISFSYRNNFNANEIWGIDYLPTCLDIFGITTPGTGAYLLSDYRNDELIVTDVNGTELAKIDSPTSAVIASALVHHGQWAGSIVTLDRSLNAITYIDRTGKILTTVSLAHLIRRATSIAYIDNPVSQYAHHLLISAERNESNSNVKRILIISQSGELKLEIDLSAHTNVLRAVTHMPNTDKFMVVDTAEDSYVFDFSGTKHMEYDARSLGARDISGLTFNYQNCAHIYTDKNNSSRAIESYFLAE